MDWPAKIRAFRALSGVEQRLLVESVMWLAAMTVLLRYAPPGRVSSLISRGSPAPTGRASFDISAKIAAAVSRVAYHFPLEAACLAQALAARAMLSRRGLGSTLHLGARKSADGQFHAHAWLTSRGEVILGGVPDLSEFSVISTFE